MVRIEAVNMKFGYGKKSLFENVNFDISTNGGVGHVVSVMGPSGSGKSSLLKLILGLEQPVAGSVVIKPETAVISYLPQEPVLFEHLSPLKNALLFKNMSRTRKMFSNDIFNEVTKVLELGHLLETAKKISQLSGGEKQRIALLRAISLDPLILLMDEPTAGLDSSVKTSLLLKLKELTTNLGTLVLYVTHNSDEADLVADEILYIENNEITRHTLQKFKEFPPTLSALSAFKHPACNIIRYKVEANFIVISDSEYDDSLYLNDENILLTESEGFEFNLISSNDIYSTIRITGSDQVLIIKNEKIKSNKRIQFNGRCLNYSNKGILINNLQLTYNKVIE